MSAAPGSKVARRSGCRAPTTRASPRRPSSRRSCARKRKPAATLAGKNLSRRSGPGAKRRAASSSSSCRPSAPRPIGAARSSPWIRPTRRPCSGCSSIFTARDTSTAASAWSTGAPAASQRSPTRKWRCGPRRACSTRCVMRWWTSPAHSSRSRRPAPRRFPATWPSRSIPTIRVTPLSWARRSGGRSTARRSRSLPMRLWTRNSAPARSRSRRRTTRWISRSASATSSPRSTFSRPTPSSTSSPARSWRGWSVSPPARRPPSC